MVAEVILDKSEQLPAQGIFSRFVRKCEMAHFVKRGFAEELYDIHT